MTEGRAEYAVAYPLVAALAAASVAAFAAVPHVGGPGRFLVALVGAVAAAEALRSVLQRPTLRADAHGVEVVVGFRRRRIPWTRVAAVGTLRPPSSGGHLRRSGNALEIDLGDDLVVVPAYRLGAPVTEVAAALAAFDEGGGGGF